MAWLNKKGIVFTVLSLVIGSFILILFFQMIELPPDNKVDVTRTKVRQVNNLLDQSIDLIRTQAIISSKQSISSMINVMYDKNEFVSDFDESFEDCLINGEFEFDVGDNHLCGDHSNLKYVIETNLSSFLLETMDLSTEFTLSNVSLNQSNPWFLDLNFNINVLVDEDDYFWNVSEHVSERISVLNFKDPLKAVVTDSMSSHRPPSSEDIPRIKVHNSYNNLSGDWLERPSTLNMLVHDEYYFEYNKSISFLNKLRGNLTPSDIGIVSIVPVILDGGSIVRSGNSSLDWHFWHDNSHSNSYGEYVFTDSQQITEMLNVIRAYNLDDERTIHRTIVPVDLAVAANMSDSSYFYD